MVRSIVNIYCTANYVHTSLSTANRARFNQYVQLDFVVIFNIAQRKPQAFLIVAYVLVCFFLL